MLTNCPECQLQVSDKAMICPHCGYPLKENKVIKTYTRTNKRRRLPNGFGQITELHNKNLRKPFRAMVTVGKDKHGKPICKLLKPVSYFETYNDAYAALVEYNKNPYDLTNSTMTVRELYTKWSDQYFEKHTNENSKRSITAAWRYCSAIYSMQVNDIRTRHLRMCLEEAEYNGTPASPNTKSRIKSVFNLMFDYATEYEYCTKNYARDFNYTRPERAEQAHMPYSTEEMEILWNNKDDYTVQMILFQCYSGWRPIEMLQLKIENIYLEDDYMIGGCKTANGKNRVVPIHSRIKWIVEKKIKEAENTTSGTLFYDYRNNGAFTYDSYRRRLERIRDELGLNPEHSGHDGRMHFITECKHNNVDEYAIKRMVGHSIRDITEKVYTKRDYKWLQEEIEKVP